MKFLNLFLIIFTLLQSFSSIKVDLLTHIKHRHKSISKLIEQSETLYKDKVESYVYKSSTQKKEIESYTQMYFMQKGIEKPTEEQQIGIKHRIMDSQGLFEHPQKSLPTNMRFAEVSNKNKVKDDGDWYWDVYFTQVWSSDDLYPGCAALAMIDDWNTRSLGYNQNKQTATYWSSSPQLSKDTIVAFKGKLQMTTRIFGMRIIWHDAPKEFMVLTSFDQTHWTVQSSWQSPFKEPVDDKLKPGDVWTWEQYKDICQFQQEFLFDTIFFANHVKILMREQICCEWFGLNFVNMYTKTDPIIIKQLTKEENTCFTVRHGEIKEETGITTADCIDSTALYDNRELFYFGANNQISTYEGDQCLFLEHVRDMEYVKLMDCVEAFQNYNLQSRWVLTKDNHICSVQDTKWCLKSVKDDKVDNAVYQGKAIASSVITTGDHSPQGPIDGSGNYWMSNLGPVWAANFYPVSYTVHFIEVKTVRKIHITWKYIPKIFDILVQHNENIWEIVFQSKENDINTLDMEIPYRNVIGLKIILKQGSLLKGRPVYGIEKLFCESWQESIHVLEYKEVIHEIDGKKEVRNNLDMWEIIPIEKKHNNLFKTVFDDRVQLLDNYGQAIKLNNKIAPFPPNLDKMIKFANDAKVRMDKIEEIMQELNFQGLKVENVFKQIAEDQGENKIPIVRHIGCTKDLPANNCASIKQIYPEKISGYYWLKTDCSDLPLRGWCDFQQGKGLFYYFRELDQTSKLTSQEEIDTFCKKLFLEPLVYRTEQHIDTVGQVLRDMGLKMDVGFVVPIAYDWGCDLGLCEKRFKGFTTIESLDITNYLPNLIDDKNIDNNEFSKETGQNWDAVGFQPDFYKLQYLTLDRKKKLGIVCSDNDDQTVQKALPFDCARTIKGDPLFSDGQLVRVQCPDYCMGYADTNKIWGDQEYLDESSVCLAAIHSGKLKMGGPGIVDVFVTKGRSTYVASLNNGITSIQKDDANPDNVKTFMLKKWQPKCRGYHTHPLFDPLVDKKNFLQFSEQETLSELLGHPIMSQASSTVDKKIKELGQKNTNQDNSEFDHSNDLSKLVQRALNDEKDGLNKNNHVSSSFDAEQIHKLNEETHNKNYLIDKKKFDKHHFHQIHSTAGEEEEEEEDNVVENQPDNYVPKNTPEAIAQVLKLLEKEDVQLLQFAQFGQEFKKLTEKIAKVLAPLQNSDLSPEKQFKRLDFIFKSWTVTYQFIDALFKTTSLRVDHFTLMLKELQHKFDSGLLWDTFLEDYNGEMDKDGKWFIWDNYLSAHYSADSKWKYEFSNLPAHPKCIRQAAMVKCLEPCNSAPTLALYDFRKWYDGHLTMTLMMRDTGKGGVIFRALDQYNYYAFEFQRHNKTEESFKRLIRVKHGMTEVLAEYKDGGYMEDTWYRLRISMHLNLFTVQMGEESKVNDDDSIPTIFKNIQDEEFARGKVGLLTDYNDQFYVDNFTMTATPGKDVDPESEIQYFSPTCSRYNETTFGAFDLRWKVEDPPNAGGGESKWEFSEFKGRKVIKQSMPTYGKGNKQQPTLAVLQHFKSCKDGGFLVTFNAQQEGYINIRWRQQDLYNYYELILYNDKDGQRTVANVVKDDVKKQLMVKEGDEFSWKPDNWFTVNITMHKTKMNVYMGSYTNQMLAMELNDRTLDEGFVAIGTYKTPASFSEIELFVIDFEKSSDEEEEEIEIIKPEKPWQDCLDHNTYYLQQSFCQNKFQADDESLLYCKSQYCRACCDIYTEYIKPLDTYSCNHECVDKKSLPQPEKEEKMNSCLQLKYPDQTVYKFCEIKFQFSRSSRQRCQQDMCKMCCVEVPSINQDKEMKSDDSQIKKCQSECQVEYEIEESDSSDDELMVQLHEEI